MAVTLDGEAILNEQLNLVTSWTSSGTKTTAGSNRVVYLAIAGAMLGSGWSISATYGGTPMTKILDYQQSTDTQYTGVFRLIAPATAASTITMSTGGSVSFSGRAIVWSVQDADQRNPERNLARASGASSSSTITIASAIGDLAIAVLGEYNQNPTPNQTQIAEGSNSDGTRWGAVQRADGAASVTFTWTGFGGVGNWATTAFSIRPALPQRIVTNRLRPAVFAPGIGN